jgi:hypothetical protein
MDYRITPGTGDFNFSPVGFRKAAREFLLCANSFRPGGFSVVPYFLYCRAIELGLKARHLETRSQREVKGDLLHDLVKSYSALPAEHRILAGEDAALLEQTSKLYRDKAFEYVRSGDAGRGYSNFPDLSQLARLASQLVR